MTPESHSSNYKYRSKKYFHHAQEWGWGERLADLYKHIILRERNSNINNPFLYVNEALDSAKDVFLTPN